jgi:hypothetical protein
MIRKKVRLYAIAISIMVIVVGAALALCSRPVFTLMRDEVREVPRSEIIMDYSFNIHQSQDKLVQFTISIGQKLEVHVVGSGIFNFSIANFTDPSSLIQPDQPDVVYLSLENTTSVDTVWSPIIRSAQPGSYYLIFLARNASVDYPVSIMANVTKTWTDIQTYGVPYLGSILDSGWAYVGLGILILGGATFLIAFFSRDHS